MSGTSGKVALVEHQTSLGCGSDCDAPPASSTSSATARANDCARARPTPGTEQHHVGPAQSRPFVEHRQQRHRLHRRRADTEGRARDGDRRRPDCARDAARRRACVPGTTTIQDIQGAGFISLVDGQPSSKRAGIVTAVRAAGQQPGFWIQQAERPTRRRRAPRPGSSSSPARPRSRSAVGDAVLVTGRVTRLLPAGVRRDAWRRRRACRHRDHPDRRRPR